MHNNQHDSQSEPKNHIYLKKISSNNRHHRKIYQNHQKPEKEPSKERKSLCLFSEVFLVILRISRFHSLYKCISSPIMLFTKIALAFIHLFHFLGGFEYKYHVYTWTSERGAFFSFLHTCIYIKFEIIFDETSLNQQNKTQQQSKGIKNLFHYYYLLFFLRNGMEKH